MNACSLSDMAYMQAGSPAGDAGAGPKLAGSGGEGASTEGGSGGSAGESGVALPKRPPAAFLFASAAELAAFQAVPMQERNFSAVAWLGAADGWPTGVVSLEGISGGFELKKHRLPLVDLTRDVIRVRCQATTASGAGLYVRDNGSRWADAGVTSLAPDATTELELSADNLSYNQGVNLRAISKFGVRSSNGSQLLVDALWIQPRAIHLETRESSYLWRTTDSTTILAWDPQGSGRSPGKLTVESTSGSPVLLALTPELDAAHLLVRAQVSGAMGTDVALVVIDSRGAKAESQWVTLTSENWQSVTLDLGVATVEANVVQDLGLRVRGFAELDQIQFELSPFAHP
jgi:hypothetical protein